MSANISSPQLREKLDTLFSLISEIDKQMVTVRQLATTLDVNVGNDLFVTGDGNVGGDLSVTGQTTLDGGAVGYDADDSAGVGFRYVIVPNAV